MLTISDAASEKIKEVLKAEGKEGWGIRLYMAGGGCCTSYGIDLAEQATEGDETIEKNGAKVFVDKQTIEAVGDMTVDFVDTGEQQGFVLTGGKSSCGPGCSSCE